MSFGHSAHAIDFCDKFLTLMEDQRVWSQETFGKDTERGPIGALKHLELEAREAQDAVGTPAIREELADCFLLLFDAARRAGMSAEELVREATKKMAKNKKRKWQVPVNDEPVLHVE